MADRAGPDHGLATVDRCTQLLGHLRASLDADATLLTRHEGRLERCIAVSGPGAAGVPGEAYRAAGPGADRVATPVVGNRGQRLGTLICLRRRRSGRLTAQGHELLRAAAVVLAASVQALLDGPSPRPTPSWLTTVVQPIVDLADHRVVAAEALSRFAGDPPPAPGDVFGLAALARLGQPLELAALESALGALDLVPPGVPLYVNASPPVAVSRQLRELLARAGTDRFVLELTEYDDTEPALLNAALDPLRADGLRVAVDDLGTGNARLQRLIALRPDVVKLDRSLTADIDRDPYRQALVRSMVSFGADTGSRIIAEGIETRGQADVLHGLGVRFGQGFHLAVPDLPERVFRGSTRRGRLASWPVSA